MTLDQIEKLIDEKYSEPHRYYHNKTHLDYMFKVAKENGVELVEPLKHLIYCHDVIYEPGNPENEKLSGVFAQQYYQSVCEAFQKADPFALITFDYEPHTYYPLIIDMTKDHIIKFRDDKTKGMIWNWLEVAQNLIDLDLAILGDTPELYQEYVTKVRLEYAHATDEQWRAGRLEWILSMLARKSIYYTDWGKKREDQARKNFIHEAFSYNLTEDEKFLLIWRTPIRVLTEDEKKEMDKFLENFDYKDEHEEIYEELLGPEEIDALIQSLPGHDNISQEGIDRIQVSQTVDGIKRKTLTRLKEKGNQTFNSSHEILGIVAEEYDELLDAVRSNNLDEVQKELLDIAVACVWGLVSIRRGVKW